MGLTRWHSAWCRHSTTHRCLVSSITPATTVIASAVFFFFFFFFFFSFHVSSKLVFGLFYIPLSFSILIYYVWIPTVP